MATDFRTSLVAVVVGLGCLFAVTIGVVRAPDPKVRRLASERERPEMAQAIATQEHGWIAETTQNFPSDDWSQRDDFHGRELHKIVELTNEKGVRIEEVLRAVDDDIHRRRARSPGAPDDRNARAIPCKPRPFYD